MNSLPCSEHTTRILSCKACRKLYQEEYYQTKRKSIMHNEYNKESKSKYNSIYFQQNKNDKIFREKRKLTKQKLKADARMFVDNLKSNPCSHCLKCFPVYVMEYDHIEPSKKSYSISYMVKHGMSITTIKREIEKCILLCANCHRNKTYKERKPGKDIKTNKLRTRINLEFKNKPCLDCNIQYNYWQMDFDHLSEKCSEISKMIGSGYAYDRIVTEIKKCDLVCRNCHKIRTNLRSNREK